MKSWSTSANNMMLAVLFGVNVFITQYLLRLRG